MDDNTASSNPPQTRMTRQVEHSNTQSRVSCQNSETNINFQLAHQYAVLSLVILFQTQTTTSDRVFNTAYMYQ